MFGYRKVLLTINANLANANQTQAMMINADTRSAPS
jgi:hypothetical protein